MCFLHQCRYATWHKCKSTSGPAWVWCRPVSCTLLGNTTFVHVALPRLARAAARAPGRA